MTVLDALPLPPDEPILLGGPGYNNWHPLPVETYPNGDPLVRVETTYDPFKMLVRPRNMTDFVAAMFFADSFKARRPDQPLHLILPCPPGSRQDRINYEGDVLFSARSVAEMINARNFATVSLLDPHSEVMPALIDRCFVSWASPSLFEDNGYDGIVSPDAGAEKRAWRVASALGLPLIHGWKHRDVKDGSLTGFGAEAIYGAKLLVVDDLCDGGGTFIGLADVLRELDNTLDLFVSHGFFTKGTAHLLEKFDTLYTTDSVISNKEGATVFPTCNTQFQLRRK